MRIKKSAGRATVMISGVRERSQSSNRRPVFNAARITCSGANLGGQSSVAHREPPSQRTLADLEAKEDLKKPDRDSDSTAGWMRGGSMHWQSEPQQSLRGALPPQSILRRPTRKGRVPPIPS
eukprot:3015364-Rhodomonas_salina.1